MVLHLISEIKPAIRLVRFLSFVCCSLLWAGGCDIDRSRAPSSAVPTHAAGVADRSKTKPKLIVLISIDTLRADHLSLYGHHRFTSPMLDLFALEGTVFEDANSASPWTLPAHASILTGLYPLKHGVIDDSTRLPDEVPTLAGLLESHGWKTAAAVNTAWLIPKNYQLTRNFQHFLYVQDIAEQRFPTSQVTDRAIQWINEFDSENLFVFMHYFDLHSDYASLQKYERLFLTPYSGKADGSTWQLQLATFPEAFIDLCQKNFDSKLCRFGIGDSANDLNSSSQIPVFDFDDSRHIEELYDAGIRQLDTELNRFFQFLEDSGQLESARIIITSDHGEEFFEHGSFYHFVTTYQEVLHVPLIFRGVGIPSGRRIATPVSVVDIAPTVLSWAGVPIPEAIDGVDLTPLLESEGDIAEFSGRSLHSEAAGGIMWGKTIEGVVPIFSSIRKGNYKLVLDSLTGAVELYDLKDDPLEKTDLSLDEPLVVQALRQEMADRKEKIEAGPSFNNRLELDSEERERLRALGYVIGD